MEKQEEDLPQAKDHPGSQNTQSAARVFTIKNCLYLCLVGIGSTWYLFQLVPETTFFVDESGWIIYGAKLGDALLDGDFSRDRWEQESSYGELNLSIGKLIIGMPVAIYARLNELHLPTQHYDWTRSKVYNLLHNNLPDKRYISLARQINAIFGSFICVILCALGLWLRGWFTGLSAVTLLLLNPLFLESTTRAMTDAFYVFFLLLALVAVIGWHSTSGRKRRFLFILFCGCMGGLAAGVKFIGLPIVFSFFLLASFFSWGMGKANLKTIFLHSFCLAAFGMFTIYTLNPNYWPRFSGFNAAEMNQELHALFVEKKGVPYVNNRSYKIGIFLLSKNFQRTEIRDAYPQFSSTILPLAEYFLLPARWNQLYESLNRRHSYLKPGRESVSYNIFVGYRAVFAEAFFLIVGLVYCIRQTWKAIIQEKAEPLMILLTFFWLYLIFVFLTLKFDAARYYLPSVAISAIISGIGLSVSLEYFRQLWMKRRKKATTKVTLPSGVE